MWAYKNEAIENKARQAKLLVFFGDLTNDNKELVMRVSNVILETSQKMSKGLLHGKGNEARKLSSAK